MTTRPESVTLKSLAVRDRVEADFGFGRDRDVFVDDRASDAGVLADDHIFHDDGFSHIGMVMDTHVR